MKKLINVAVTLLMFICAAFVCSCSEKEIEELKDIAPIIPENSTESVVKGYYEIPKEYIKDWDTGILTTDKHYFLVRKDSASNGYECYMNDSVNSTKGVAIYVRISAAKMGENISFNLSPHKNITVAAIKKAGSTKDFLVILISFM